MRSTSQKDSIGSRWPTQFCGPAPEATRQVGVKTWIAAVELRFAFRQMGTACVYELGYSWSVQALVIREVFRGRQPSLLRFGAGPPNLPEDRAQARAAANFVSWRSSHCEP